MDRIQTVFPVGRFRRAAGVVKSAANQALTVSLGWDHCGAENRRKNTPEGKRLFGGLVVHKLKWEPVAGTGGR